MRSAILMLVALILLLAACGAPDQPIAQEPSPAPPQASTAPAQPANPSPQPATNAAPQAANGTPVARGKRLRDVWPGVKNNRPTVTILLYSAVVPADGEEPSRTSAFWSVDLNNVNSRQKIIETTTDESLSEPIFGQLSPDGTLIAYLKPVTDSLADLYVIGNDGTGNQKIATQLRRGFPQCHRSFMWSNDGTKIAFIRVSRLDGTYVDELATYDLRSNTASDPIPVGWAFLVGWQGPQRVLAITSSGQGQPRMLDAIDAPNKNRQALGQLPEKAFFCSNPSPDRQKILLDLGSSYLFTTTTKAFCKLDTAAEVSAWNPDSATIVEITSLKPNIARVLNVTTDQPSAQSVALTDTTPAPLQTLLSASPDGHYLAVCERRDIGFDRSLYRTLLYDIVNDRWEPLLEGQGCVKVLGWQ